MKRLQLNTIQLGNCLSQQSALNQHSIDLDCTAHTLAAQLQAEMSLERTQCM
jgi:hypothetical protein